MKKNTKKNIVLTKKVWIIIASVLLVVGLAVAGYIYFGNKASVVSTDSTGKTVVSSGDTISVDYVGRLDDGTIFDSSIESFAKQMKNYTPGRTFEPLEFTVGAGQMIPGFDAGVVGMELGEKKTLVIAPKDAYGELKEQEVNAKYLQDVFTEVVPRENFKDIVTQTVPKSALGESGKDLTVGKVIEAGSTKAKVAKIEGDNVTVEIENTGNPFYGKKLAVGLTGEFEGNTVVVKKLTDKEVTIEVNNKTNPFYGKKIEVGMEWMAGGNRIKIVAIAEDKVTIAAGPELAGKTLTFDVEIKSIK